MANQPINNMENENKIGQFFKRDFDNLSKQLQRLRQMVGGKQKDSFEGADDDYLYDEDAEFNEGLEPDPGLFPRPIINPNIGPVSGYGTGLVIGFSGIIPNYSNYMTGHGDVSGHRVPYVPARIVNLQHIYVESKYKKTPVYKKKHHPLTSIFADKKND